MTFAMYEALFAHCERVDADDDVRVLVLRGAGEKAFVAGTDIRQFAEFDESGEDGARLRGDDRPHRRPAGDGAQADRRARRRLRDGLRAWRSSAACDLRVLHARPRRSACRSRARSATACRWRTTRGWPRCSARRG